MPACNTDKVLDLLTGEKVWAALETKKYDEGVANVLRYNVCRRSVEYASFA